MSAIVKLTMEQAEAVADAIEDEAPALAAQLRTAGPFVLVVLR